MTTDVHFIWKKVLKCFDDNIEAVVSPEVRLTQIAKVQKLRTKYPKELRILEATCAFHHKAKILVVRHRSKKLDFGTTLVTIPIETKAGATQFFMTPEQLDKLSAVISSYKAK